MAEKLNEALQCLMQGTNEGPDRMPRINEHEDTPTITPGTSTEDWLPIGLG